MPVVLPGPDTRWRCGACGNLTRFDVVRAVRSREFWHVTLAGQAEVAEREVLSEQVEKVACRWCGAVDSVVLEPRPHLLAGAVEMPAGVTGTAPDAPSDPGR